MYGGTPLYGHQVNMDTLMHIKENFGCLDKKFIYFLGKRTFSCARASNDKFRSVVNPPVRTLFMFELYNDNWITRENLKKREMAFQSRFSLIFSPTGWIAN